MKFGSITLLKRKSIVTQTIYDSKELMLRFGGYTHSAISVDYCIIGGRGNARKVTKCRGLNTESYALNLSRIIN